MSRKYKRSSDVPNEVLAARLFELALAIPNKNLREGELTMRIPAEVDRDADLVIGEAARRLRARGGSGA